jgi:hypothetical protein
MTVIVSSPMPRSTSPTWRLHTSETRIPLSTISKISATFRSSALVRRAASTSAWSLIRGERLDLIHGNPRRLDVLERGLFQEPFARQKFTQALRARK